MPGPLALRLSATVDRAELTGMRKRKPTLVTLETPVCNDCNKTLGPGASLRANAPR
jgi:hypothetical protein